MNLRFSRLYFMPFLKANYQLNKAETVLPSMGEAVSANYDRRYAFPHSLVSPDPLYRLRNILSAV